MEIGMSIVYREDVFPNHPVDDILTGDSKPETHRLKFNDKFE